MGSLVNNALGINAILTTTLYKPILVKLITAVLSPIRAAVVTSTNNDYYKPSQHLLRFQILLPSKLSTGFLLSVFYSFIILFSFLFFFFT